VATYVWQSTDGDGQNPASWGGTVPGTGDTAAFKGTSQVSMAAGMAFSGDPLFVVYPQYKGNIGTPSEGVSIFSGASTWIHRGPGTFYHGATLVNNVILDSHLFGHNTYELLTDGRIVNLWIKSGRAHIHGAALSNSLVAILGEQARCVIEEETVAAVDPWRVIVAGGVLENKRNYTGVFSDPTILLTGGILDQTGILQDNMAIRITGGELRYHPRNDPVAETIGPHIVVLGGILDLSEMQFPFNGTVIVGPRGKVVGNNVDTIGSIVDFDLRQDYP
jgi:hypothetical protein